MTAPVLFPIEPIDQGFEVSHGGTRVVEVDFIATIFRAVRRMGIFDHVEAAFGQERK